MVAQDRRRAEDRRRVQYLRLGRGDRARRFEQEHHRRFQAELVGARRHAKAQALPHIGRDADKIGSPDGGVVVRGTSALATNAKQGKQPMNAIRSEKIESTDEDNNLAAVSEVEEGIRDFVRNDIAYLRRPAPSIAASTDVAVDPNA